MSDAGPVDNRKTTKSDPDLTVSQRWMAESAKRTSERDGNREEIKATLKAAIDASAEGRPASSLPAFYHRKDSAGNTMAELLVQRDSARGKAKQEIRRQIQSWTKEFNAPQNPGSAANSGTQGKIPDGNIRAKWKKAKESEKSAPDTKPISPTTPKTQPVVTPPVVVPPPAIPPPVVVPPVDPSIPKQWRDIVKSQPKQSEGDRNRDNMQAVTASQDKISGGEKQPPQPQTSSPISGTIRDALSKIIGTARGDAQPGSAPPPPTKNGDKLDRLQLGLDVAGVVGDFAGGAGAIADGTNAAISLGRAWKEPQRRKEHIFNAGVSAVSMVPFVGDLAKGLKAKGAARTAKRAIGGAAETGAKAGRPRDSHSRSMKAGENVASETVSSPASKLFDRMQDALRNLRGDNLKQSTKETKPQQDFDEKPWLGDSINAFVDSAKAGKSLPVKGDKPSLAEMRKNSVSGADAARTFAEHSGAYNGKTGEVDVLKIAKAMEEMTRQHANLPKNRPADNTETQSPSIGDPKRGKSGGSGGGNPPKIGRLGGSGDEESDGKRAFFRFRDGLKKSGEKLLGLVPVVGKLIAGASAFVIGLRGVNTGVLALNRDLEKYNGRIAQAYAKSDVRDMQRDVKKGESLDGSLSRLSESQSELKDKISEYAVPMQIALIEILNVATQITNMGLEAIKFFSPTLAMLMEIANNTGKDGHEANTTFNEFFQDVADGKLDGKKPKF